jgi:hypothetical protein
VGPAESRKPPGVLNAITLGVFGDLTGTLAAFMPMKSVFILAADEVPGFFPQFLITAGPAAVAVFLIFTAAVLAFMSGIARKIVNSVAAPNTPINSSHFRHRNQVAKGTRGLELGEATALSLVTVLLIGTVLISVLFTVLVLVWVIGSLAVLSIHIHRSVRRPPFATGAAEFSARFSKWVSISTLWSTVVSAIVTLLASPPALGMTGILLAAVLLARFQQSVSKLAPLVYEGRARLTHADDPLLSSQPASAVRSPAEFFATVAGRRTLNQLFENLNLNHRTWSLVGQPTNTQLSLVTRDKVDGGWRIIRIFAHGRDDLMNRELQLRTRADRAFLSGSWDAHPETAWGLPTIVLSGEVIDETVSSTEATATQLYDTQIRWELDSLMTDDISEPRTSSEADALAQSIRNGLYVISKFPGRHQQATSSLLSTIEPVLENLRSSPVSFSTGNTISGRNVLQHAPDELTILDLSGWQALPFGWFWPVTPKFLDRVALLGERRGTPASVIELGTVNSLLAELHRALKGKHLRKIEALSTELFEISR